MCVCPDPPTLCFRSFASRRRRRAGRGSGSCSTGRSVCGSRNDRPNKVASRRFRRTGSRVDAPDGGRQSLSLLPIR
ncbi:hypothetical protein B8V81_0059 [Paenibacillus pasadenensis]|uniref:Uncharacterized protein n=1 Tax=Paenibacillus pasadenensis TaxID=217090 RepID=A0A2N5NC60_9BACL|nr:hypothetical protein B8V81_0059 [Paenibacillus pasadenensis]